MSDDPLDTASEIEEMQAALARIGPAELHRRVQLTLDAARPAIQRDGGDIALVEIEPAGIVRVRLSGACTHCKLAGQTLGGIRRTLTHELGVPVRVLPALS